MTFVGATTENPSFEVIGALFRAPRCTCSRACPKTISASLLERARRRWRSTQRGARAPDRFRRRRCAPAAERGGDSRDRGAGCRHRSDRRAIRRADAGEEPAPLRQAGRAVLRPDLGAAQGGARIGSGCGAVLDGAHARRRRRSALRRPARRAHGGRRRRPCRPARAAHRARCVRDLRAARLARRRARARRGGDLPRRAPRNRTRPTSPTRRRARSSPRTAPAPCRCTSATRRRG